MLIWSAAESCATIMCSSIPVLRPLYTRLRYGSKGSSAGTGDSSYQLPMYARNRHYGGFSSNKSGFKTSELDGTTTVDLGIDTYHQKTVISHSHPTSGSNGSNEDILRGAAGIERTDEVEVTYERFERKME
jgi:hypothetical protein